MELDERRTAVEDSVREARDPRTRTIMLLSALLAVLLLVGTYAVGILAYDSLSHQQETTEAALGDQTAITAQNAIAARQNAIAARRLAQQVKNLGGVPVVQPGDLTPVPGPQGVPGLNGLPGINGVNGKNGKPGTPGAPGEDGLDGTDGTNGVNGVDGKDGQPGQDGAPGKDGTNGTNGTDGVSLTNVDIVCQPQDTIPPTYALVFTMQFSDGTTQKITVPIDVHC
jgi:hypothetical protein